MKVEGVAVKVAPSLLSGGRQHPMVAFAVLTDLRLSRCNPLSGGWAEAVASGGGARCAY